jgi:glycosyltransferase involved in cell wall biosynthesis
MWSYGTTGGSIVLYNFMDNLVKRGHEIHAIFPEGSIKWEVGIWKDEIKKSKTRNFKSKLFSFFNNTIFNYLKLNYEINELNRLYEIRRNIKGLIKNWVESDITISTFHMTAYAGYYLSDRTVSLYHMQHYEELFSKDKMERLIAKNTYYFPLIKIANSSWLQTIMEKNFKSKSYLVNPGIDLITFKPSKVIEEKYINKKEWTVVSYVDENRKFKGFDDALKAVKLAREHLKLKDIKLNWKVFGYSKPSNEHETEFEYVGKLFAEDLAKTYSNADLVLLTSWYESFPLPPIEAMACGSVVITTSYGTEDYVFDKKNGLVCLPRKIDEIAEKIIYAIENPDKCLIMVENGLKTVQDYNWEKRTDILEKILYESLENYSFEEYVLVENLANGQFEEIYENFN